MQLTFGDAEGLCKRKQTRREIFLSEMERVVPRKALLAQIEPRHPRSGRVGRPPCSMETMQRIHLQQQWYTLSDPGIEEALHEIASMRLFARLSGLDVIPDETTILNFRRLLEKHDLAVKMPGQRPEPARRHNRGCHNHPSAQLDQERHQGS